MRLAFAPPRFGPGVLGGSEAVMREAALGLAERGHQVEILTTCALDHFTWANELPAGESMEKGLTVRRFPAVRHPSRAALAAQLSIQAGQIPDFDHQVSWLGFQFTVPGLFEHILRHGSTYDAIIFSPYLFWTASACVPFVAERAVVIPCLHDEVYARLDVLRPVLADPALVWFLSEPEHQLAHRLGPVAGAHEVTGAGITVPGAYDPEGFRARHQLPRPFLLYAGRKEDGKGVQFLLDAFATAVSTGLDADLVLIGRGSLVIPKPVASRVVDLGYLTDQERNDAFAAAAAHVQPSPHESFSRTIMEAWLAGTPVLARSASDVVTWHLERSGGGLPFSDGPGLAAGLRAVLGDTGRREELALAGRRYVLDNYTWPAVLDRMEGSLGATFGAYRRRPTSLVPPAPGPAARRLVVGSYPPVPGEAAAATLAAVRRAWNENREVVVASPRPSAASVVARLAGAGAARAVRGTARAHGCSEVVFCLEPGMPFSDRRRAGGWRDRRAARRLAGVLQGFQAAELVVTGDLGLPAKVLAPLWAVTNAVTASSEAAARLAKATGAGDVRVVDPYTGWGAAAATARSLPAIATVSPFEPGDLLLRRRLLRLMGAAARRLLGRRAPAVRARLARLVRLR
jgi:glycosyltransferase involved in cell wall biosynthesis